MNDEKNNVYDAPIADLERRKPDGDAKILSMAKGQKLLIYGIVCYFLIIPARALFLPLAGLIMLAMVVFSIWGVIKILKGMETLLFIKITIFILLFIPLVNLIVMLLLNREVTKRLEYAGYDVGFLGVKNQG